MFVCLTVTYTQYWLSKVYLGYQFWLHATSKMKRWQKEVLW